MSNRLLDELAHNEAFVKVGAHSCRMVFFPENIQAITEGKILAPKWGNWFDSRNGEISYSTKPPEKNEKGAWKRKGRQLCRPSKLLTYIVRQFQFEDFATGDISDIPVTEYDKLKARWVEILATRVGMSNELEIQVSDDVYSIYRTKVADSGVGTLERSCMNRGKEYACSAFPDFYNILGVKIAYIENDDGELLARALLWHGVKIHPKDRNWTKENDTIDMMDRIYGTEEHIEMFKQWAMENNYFRKEEQSWDNPTILLNGVWHNYFSYSAHVGNIKFYGFPYLDTLCFYKYSNNMVTLSTFDIDYEKRLQECHAFSHTTQCYECGDFIVHSRGDEYHEIDGYVYCDNCCVYSSKMGEHILRKNAVESEQYNSYIPAHRSINIPGVGFVLRHDPKVIKIDGVYYWGKAPDRYAKCPECNHYFLKEVMTQQDDGTLMCKRCAGIAGNLEDMNDNVSRLLSELRKRNISTQIMSDGTFTVDVSEIVMGDTTTFISDLFALSESGVDVRYDFDTD